MRYFLAVQSDFVSGFDPWYSERYLSTSTSEYALGSRFFSNRGPALFSGLELAFRLSRETASETISRSREIFRQALP